VLYEQQVQTLRNELAEITAVMARLEQSYQDTAKAFRLAQSEKEKLQSENTELKYSKTAVEARLVVIEQALLSTRTELSHLSKTFEEKEDELRAIAGVKAVLERRLSELTLSHAHERNVTRNISERLVHVQGTMAENVDWMYDMRDDLTEESKYLYLHYLHNGGGAGLGLKTPPLPRLPSYGSAINSPAGSPSRATGSALKDILEYSVSSAVPTDVKVSEAILAAAAAVVAPPVGFVAAGLAVVAPPAASIPV